MPNQTTNLDAAKLWPAVTWDHRDLADVATAIRLINPHVTYSSAKSAAAYVRSESERALYRALPNVPYGMMYGIGAFTVVFVRNAPDAPDGRPSFTAWPAVTGYAARRYVELSR